MGAILKKTNPRVDQCKLGVHWYNIINKHSCFSEQCYFRNTIVHDAYLTNESVNMINEKALNTFIILVEVENVE